MDLLAKQGIATPLRSARSSALFTTARLIAAFGALVGMTGFSYLANVYPYLKVEPSEYEVLSPMGGSLVPSVWAAACLGTILALGVFSLRGLPVASRPIRSLSDFRLAEERRRRLLGFTTFVLALYFACVFYFKLWFVATLIEFPFHQETFVWTMNFGETPNPQTIASFVLLVALVHSLLGAWASDSRSSSRCGVALILLAGLAMGVWGHYTLTTPRASGVAWGGFWVRQGAPGAYQVLGRPFLGSEQELAKVRTLLLTHDAAGDVVPIRRAVDSWFSDEELPHIKGW